MEHSGFKEKKFGKQRKSYRRERRRTFPRSDGTAASNFYQRTASSAKIKQKDGAASEVRESPDSGLDQAAAPKQAANQFIADRMRNTEL